MGMFTRMTEHLERQSTLMGGMIDRLDVDFEEAKGMLLGQQLGRAVRACISCRHADACQAWQTAHADGADKAPAFCPNADLWTSLRHA